MKISTALLSIILAALLSYAVIELAIPGNADESMIKTERSPSRAVFPFKNGERLTYEVRYNKLKVGGSVLTFNGEKVLGDKKVYHVTFFTRIPSFRDTEELYADKDSFLPIEVHRTIRKKIGFDDKIIERYNQDNCAIEIKQKSKLRSKEFTIQRDSPIQNAILLAYQYRAQQSFDEKEKTRITLPTLEFDIIYKGIESVETPMGTFSAHVFISEPSKFRLWLSADDKRIPLKIENPSTLGYALVLKSIE